MLDPEMIETSGPSAWLRIPRAYQQWTGREKRQAWLPGAMGLAGVAGPVVAAAVLKEPILAAGLFAFVCVLCILSFSNALPLAGPSIPVHMKPLHGKV